MTDLSYCPNSATQHALPVFATTPCKTEVKKLILGLGIKTDFNSFTSFSLLSR